MPKRPTIGLFVDNLFDEHEETLRRSVIEAAESKDLNLLFFLGGPAWGQRRGKAIYELAGPEVVDGIIAVAGCIDMSQEGHGAGSFGDDEAQAFFRSYAPIPMVSISKIVQGWPSLIGDNVSGARKLMTHFIEVHHRKRIAYIRGPQNNAEADTRFDVYRASLEEHGLPYDPERVVAGDFNRESGTVAVKTLLDERRIDLDSLLAANDYMAIYGMKELQRRGYKVPDDVAVAGFDDNRYAMSVVPSLTTVRQSLRDMGRLAVDHILTLIRGGTVPAKTEFPTEMVVRRSCGCIALTAETVDVSDLVCASGQSAAETPRTALARRLEALHPRLKESIGVPSWADQLAGALFEDLERGQEIRFLPMIERLVIRGFECRIKGSQWREILRYALETARSRVDSALWKRLDAFWESSLAMIGDLAEQTQAADNIKLEDEAIVLQHVFRLTGVEEDEIKLALKRELPKLGVRSFYLALYHGDTLEEALLEFHYSFNDDVVLDETLGPYPSKQLLPGRFTQDHRYAYAVLPIHSSAERMGFAVSDIGRVSGASFESLVYQLGRSLKASALLKEVKRYACELEARIDERTRQLKQAQQKIVEIAHQAGMAEIAVGVMHNIGNLLNSVGVSAEGIVRVAIDSRVGGLVKLNELLKAHQEELAATLGSDSKFGLLPDYCGKLAEALEGERTHVRREAKGLLEKIALIRDTIRTLQEYARDGKDLLLTEQIELQLVIEVALDIQGANAARYGVRILKQFEDIPPIIGQRAKLVHVLVNLVKNGIEAMRDMPESSRSLTVRLARHSEEMVLVQISDTGEGIAEKDLNRIFSYGFTTKSDGNGFGLHICANYVSQMGGSITVKSDGPSRGAVFSLLFRVSSAAQGLLESL